MKPKVGDHITIYHDPVECTQPEGDALVLETYCLTTMWQYLPTAFALLGCRVRFGNSPESVIRKYRIDYPEPAA
jgi:hypothetical protein